MAKPGQIGWHDLTVDDADGVRDFYSAVVGWSHEGCDMGGYEDYVMKAGEEAAGGVCHARGVNEGLPAQWLMYVAVPDLDASAAKAVELGGEIVREPKGKGTNRFCVIRDPAGAFMSLVQAETE